jgi:hypothetical protein
MKVIAACTLLFGALAGVAPLAAAGAPDADPDAKPSSRFTTRNARLDDVPQGAGRYQLRARFAAPETAGDLREGGGWALIGRFAKAGASCDFDPIFRDGFEAQ